MSLLLRELHNFLKKEGGGVMNVNLEKIAKEIEDVWLSISSLAYELGISSRELERSEVLFKFAKNLLQDHSRIMDGKFTIGIDDNEVYIGATFNGVHLHTIFMKPDDLIRKIREEFVKPEIALKSAINLFIEALEEALYKFKDWRRVNF
jgi:hypothetical protein